MQQAGARYRFTVDNYYRMAKSGILRPDDRVELIDGEVVRMSPIGARHAFAVSKLTQMLIARLGERAFITSQSPLRISSYNEPEPDIMLLVPGDERYGNAHPGPADVLLLIEVSDTSLGYDRRVKLPLYGEAGIPEVWIIDLKGHRLFAYSQPQSGSYTLVRTVAYDQQIAPAAFPDLSLSLDDLRL